MNKIRWVACVLMLTMCLGFSAAVRAADSPIKPFIDSQTTAVIRVDLSAVDLDQLNAWRQKALEASTADQAQKDQANQSAQVSVASAKDWIAKFQAAGGKDVYAIVSMGGIMRGQGGAIVAPIAPGGNGDALAKVFNPAGNPPPPDPNDPNAAMRQRMVRQTAVIGNAVVFSMAAMVEKLQTPSTEPRPDLTDALAAAGDAPLRIAIVPKSLKQFPMLGMLMGGRRDTGAAPAQAPFSDPEWDAVTWAALVFNQPPKESGSFICQCKDSDSANALAAMMSKKLEDSKTDPQAQQAFGANLDKLIAAAKPAVDGSRVTISIDQGTMDTVVGPAIARMMVRNQARRPGATATPPPPPDNGGGL